MSEYVYGEDLVPEADISSTTAVTGTVYTYARGTGNALVADVIALDDVTIKTTKTLTADVLAGDERTAASVVTNVATKTLTAGATDATFAKGDVITTVSLPADLDKKYLTGTITSGDATNSGKVRFTLRYIPR